MRGTIITTAALSLMTATLVLAQQDPSIAQAMLEQKQKERDAARAEKITITLGELDDLRQENKRLRGEVEMLKQKLGISADRPPAPETRR